MVAYAVSENINRSPEEVFPYLADPMRWDWMAEGRADRLTDGPTRTGTRFRYSFQQRGKPIDLEIEVTEHEPNRRVAFKTVSDSAMRWDGVFSAEPTGTGTLVRSTGQIRLRGIRRLFEPLMGGEVRRGEAAELSRLKAMLEGMGGQA